jgi:hypothetical protein
MIHFRAAFIACKRSGHCTALIWAFAANMEWRMNRCPDIARRLFEAGMKQFSNDTDFVLEYDQFCYKNTCPSLAFYFHSGTYNF